MNQMTTKWTFYLLDRYYFEAIFDTTSSLQFHLEYNSFYFAEAYFIVKILYGDIISIYFSHPNINEIISYIINILSQSSFNSENGILVSYVSMVFCKVSCFLVCSNPQGWLQVHLERCSPCSL